jgi:hypothetical protein
MATFVGLLLILCPAGIIETTSDWDVSPSRPALTKQE